MSKKETLKLKVVTPAGRLSFPYLTKPDTGRTYSDNKYKTDLLIPKAVWEKEGQKLIDAVLTVGRDFFGNPKLGLKDFKHPFKDTDKLEKIDEKQKGYVLIRAKTDNPPSIIGPNKNSSGAFADLSPEEVQKIKGGDWGRLQVTVYPYSQQGGGVTFALNVVQFWKPDEAFGGGKAANIAMMDEMEVPLESGDESQPASNW